MFCAQFGVPYIKACRVRPGVDLLEYLSPVSRGAAAGCSTPIVEDCTAAPARRFDWSLMPREPGPAASSSRAG